MDGHFGVSGGGLAWDERVSRSPLERGTAGGESPVGDGALDWVGVLREYRPARGIGREAGRTAAQG